jgi:hypothetical protein
MTTRHRRIFVALAAVVALSQGKASAWVVARVGPRIVGGVAVGVAAGAVAGAAVASAATPHTTVVTPPPTTVVTPPPAAPPAAAPPAAGPSPAPSEGSVVTTLPSGCTSTGERYQCGSVYYQPYFGGNGVYYRVVPP